MTEIGKLFFILLIVIPLMALLGFMVYILFYNWLDKIKPNQTPHHQ